MGPLCAYGARMTTLHSHRARLGAPAVLAAVPVAAAIGTFGIIYGAAATPLMGTGSAVLSSALIFSGATQFAMLALLGAGASAMAIVATASLLAIRHLPLGAVLTPRLPQSRLRRAGLSWFLIDETAGLALAGEGPPATVLAVSGWMAYLAWVAGTAIGALGGTAAPVEPLAAALFPVLFIGLAALATRPGGLAATLAAGALTLLLVVAVPGVGVVGALVVAVATSLVGSMRASSVVRS